uniref:Uncharacterized protein n=1 Tax=Chromera velia CCMP2878 TaxID=1169474 RepID=A0A0G4I1A6_9ALVE|eukprot:Cvel_32.t1-p1 / transcript=Cvel_32.t1 / gene=Cvel_32 / organism=Chromera_velia_CCMP2878 / gene_product=hypothetical protein / transcript_product=hypothetical protein / location=Cvel_scaffold5:181001-183841(-) / protein_length=776 / sequence_SO=supercontig / SO=protein_coding / is_pseudo=false
MADVPGWSGNVADSGENLDDRNRRLERFSALREREKTGVVDRIISATLRSVVSDMQQGCTGGSEDRLYDRHTERSGARSPRTARRTHTDGERDIRGNGDWEEEGRRKAALVMHGLISPLSKPERERRILRAGKSVVRPSPFSTPNSKFVNAATKSTDLPLPPQPAHRGSILEAALLDRDAQPEKQVLTQSEHARKAEAQSQPGRKKDGGGGVPSSPFRRSSTEGDALLKQRTPQQSDELLLPLQNHQHESSSSSSSTSKKVGPRRGSLLEEALKEFKSMGAGANAGAEGDSEAPKEEAETVAAPIREKSPRRSGRGQTLPVPLDSSPRKGSLLEEALQEMEKEAREGRDNSEGTRGRQAEREITKPARGSPRSTKRSHTDGERDRKGAEHGGMSNEQKGQTLQRNFDRSAVPFPASPTPKPSIPLRPCSPFPLPTSQVDDATSRGTDPIPSLRLPFKGSILEAALLDRDAQPEKQVLTQSEHAGKAEAQQQPGRKKDGRGGVPSSPFRRSSTEGDALLKQRTPQQSDELLLPLQNHQHESSSSSSSTSKKVGPRRGSLLEEALKEFKSMGAGANAGAEGDSEAPKEEAETLAAKSSGRSGRGLTLPVALDHRPRKGSLLEEALKEYGKVEDIESPDGQITSSTQTGMDSVRSERRKLSFKLGGGDPTDPGDRSPQDAPLLLGQSPSFTSPLSRRSVRIAPRESQTSEVSRSPTSPFSPQPPPPRAPSEASGSSCVSSRHTTPGGISGRRKLERVSLNEIIGGRRAEEDSKETENIG